MGEEKRVQLNVRVTKETLEKLDEIVEYYQQHTVFDIFKFPKVDGIACPELVDYNVRI